MTTHPESPVVKAGIDVFEGDVDPVRRHFTDHDTAIASPRRCYLDIETDSRVPFSKKEEMRILSWAVVDHDTGETFDGLLDEWSDAAERRLIEALWTALNPYDQVCAWYGDGFDFPVIFARSAHHRLKTDARRWLWMDHKEAFQRFNMHSAESGEEKRSMKLEDIGQSVTGEGKTKAPQWVTDRFGDKSLGALSYDLWEAGGEFRKLLLDYNVRDTQLLRAIEHETGYLELFRTLCEVCRLFPNTASLNPTHQMDGFMLRLGKERSYHFPTKKFRENIVKFKGAFVMQPESLNAQWRAKHGMENGIARNVHVCDFSGMYPSIILTWNMSPDTKVPAPINGPIEPGTCRTPLTGISFRTGVEGILPMALRELIRLRKFWNDKKASLPPGTPEWHDADRRSTAYKVAANSFYGVIGSPFSRYFDRNIAESVTQAGVWLLKQTMGEAERRGFVSLYGDTDSAFIMGVERGVFAEFVQWCNEDLYPRLLKEQGCNVNEIKLAYEKEFDRIVFTSAKRYAGSYRHYKWKTTCTCTTAKGDPGSLDVKTMLCKDCGAKHDTLPPSRSKPEIKGLEYKRGDVLRMAATLQAETIDLLVGGLGLHDIGGGEVPTTDLERYHAKLSRVRQRILEGPLALEEVKLSKGLSKPLREYIAKPKLDGTPAAQPPQVQVAHILKARGQDVREGTRIDFFITDGAASPMKVAPAEDWQGECDRYHLWESLVYPATQRLLEAAFPTHDWAGWAKVRPPKVRSTKASRALVGQAALFETVPTVTKTPQPRVIQGGRHKDPGGTDAKAK
jgi:DNA polymerase elongation subunit (family B)